jgi:hypothetical protein
MFTLLEKYFFKVNQTTSAYDYQVSKTKHLFIVKVLRV